MNNKPTVIDKFNKEVPKKCSFQFEAELEQTFIKQLISQGYEYLDFSKIDKKDHENHLITNLRKQIEELNNVKFTDNEWSDLFSHYIANENDKQIDKTEKIQKNETYTITREDGTSKNIRIIDKKNIHNNKLQVINQYTNLDGKYENRYDVTILVNGLPLIHIELKRRGVELKEAFNQIKRYKEDSFWASYGLFNYVQIFVISNGTTTKYYSNTTRYLRIDALQNKKIESKASNSFEFTTFWSDAENNSIEDLEDFTKTFFAKHTILNILTQYCIFTEDKKLMVMRPYQIVATERIINKIIDSNNKPEILGTSKAGGYVWHTTGSGKTATSFKTSQLASNLPYIDKVLFVVDRKDLDYQTMKEYENFQKESAYSVKSSNALKELLEDDEKRIAITTIQKLTNFIKKNPNHPIFSKHVVLIFDECHRSQFGEMHSIITSHFKKYNIFGFTGTPIFSKNSTSISTKKLVEKASQKSGQQISIDKTTDELFGQKIHTYTISDAIKDKNVLGFKYSFVSTMKSMKEGIKEEEIQDINRSKALLSDERISNITKWILDNFNQATYRDKDYSYNQISNIKDVAKDKKNETTRIIKRINIKGFNSIFVVSSIEAAKKYYYEFKKQLSQRDDIKLNIATIFSYSPNEEFSDVDDSLFLDDENEKFVDMLDLNSRQFLEEAIKDYNNMFGTTWSTADDQFQSYYKDLSMRMKNKEIDLLIVVNMFLTGFDAPTLNTLWVDKWLKMHGLIQAFSRTNRILNSIKTHGNIFSFVPLKERIDEAIGLFSDKKSSSNILIRDFKDYYEGYTSEIGYQPGYIKILKFIQSNFSLERNSRDFTELDKKEFIKAFGTFLKLRNVLLSFVDEFTDDKKVISERELQDFSARYQDFYSELKTKAENEKKDITNEVVFEMELVKQMDINLDYIFKNVEAYHKDNIKDKDSIITITTKMVDSSYELRSKKELIIMFLTEYNENKKEIEISKMKDEFNIWKKNKEVEELEKIIKSFNLDKDKTRKLMDDSYQIGELKTIGQNISNILQKTSRWSNNRTKIKSEVVEELQKHFDKFFRF